MTVSGEFAPLDDHQGYAEKPTYPTAFGIPLTPTVLGTVLGVVLVALATYLFVLLVRPALQTRSQLQAEINEKQNQLDNVEEQQRLLEQAQQRRAEAEQLQQDVLALFATEESLDTLLLDLNTRIQSVNAGIEDDDRRAVLSLFQVGDAAVVNDGSLGEAVNGRIERRVYSVEMMGGFAQTQSILRNIERLQPLLIVNNLQSTLDTSDRVLQIDLQGNLTPAGEPISRLNTSFELDALIPVPSAEIPPPPAVVEGAPPAEGAQEAGTTP